MSSSNIQTRRGQSGLLVVAFSTPFLIMGGTGGYAQASYQESTGNTSFISREKSLTPSQQNVVRHSKLLNEMKEEFDLGVDQLANLIGVSRPTIYAWLKGESKRVLESHAIYANSLFDVLESRIEHENKKYLGALLRRKLDREVTSIFRKENQEAPILVSNEDLIKSINFKLQGIKRSEILRQKLSNKKTVI